MNRDQITGLLQTLGARRIQQQAENVACSCLLAEWTHAKGADRDPSMGVQIVPGGKSRVHCFSCQFGGTLETLLNRLRMHSPNAFDYSGLVRAVAAAEILSLETVAASIKGYGKSAPAKEESVGIPFEEAKPYLGRVPKYALDRGFTMDTCKEWKLGLDAQRARLWIPVVQYGGGLVGAIGRALRPPEPPEYPRYWNYWSKTFTKSRHLFGEHKVAGEKIVVVEGPLDVIWVWQALQDADLLSLYSVVGLMGSRASREQVGKIVKYGREAILFLDNDGDGRKAQPQLADYLRSKMLTTFVIYPDEVDFQDPGSIPAEPLIAMITAAGLDI